RVGRSQFETRSRQKKIDRANRRELDDVFQRASHARRSVRLQKSDDASIPVRRSALEPTGSQSEDRYWTISGLLHYLPVALFCNVSYRRFGVALRQLGTPSRAQILSNLCEGPLALGYKVVP